LNSLERSLQLGMVVSLVLLMLLFWWAGSLASMLLTESFVYSRLRTDADSLVAALDFPELELDQPRLGEARLNPAYEEPSSGKYYFIRLQPEGEITSRSAWEQTLPIPHMAAGQLRKVKTMGVAGEPLLLWLGGFSKQGHGFTIGIAEDITPIEARLTIFQWYFAAISLLLLVALLVVQHLIVRRSVQKLEAIRSDMNKLGHGEVMSLSEDVPSEVLPLVQEFNRLLMRFDKRLKQSRNSVGNLAHSLKGPLNLLLRSSDTAGGSVSSKQQEAIAQNSERIHQLIESELKRARLAGRSAAGQLFDLEEELPALCGLLKQEYSDKNVDIRYNIAAGAEVTHDRQDMLELIGNLLDNAAKWANSVVMFTVREANGVLLDIEDDGPGCSPDEFVRLTQRGVRLDESVSGHGLGLSIVRDIVDTYDGTLEFSTSTRLGGLRVSVFLPDGASDPT
jgi:signal transduction histidine kinase